MRRRTAVLAVAILATTLAAFSATDSVTATVVPLQRGVAPSARPVVGMLNIPRLRINVPIRVGTTNAVFDIGVGQYPGSASPGTDGNLVIGGHRTSGKKPFAQIQTMKAGDPIIVTSNGIAHTYVVTRTFVVKANAMWITDPTPDPVITLFACHPRGSVSHRFVVRGVLRD